MTAELRGGLILPLLYGECLMRHFNLILAGLLLATSPAAGAIAKPAAKAKLATKPAAKPAKPATKPAAKPAALPDTPEIAELRQGFRFAFPIYEMMRTRSGQLERARAAGLVNAVNFILPRTKLADASSHEVTTPNNDTLYGSAWLDLAGGPVVLTVPALGGRYNSAALMSLTTDNTAIVGTRTGGQGGRFAIVGPGFAGKAPADAQLIRSATNDAWLLVRVVVNGPADVESATKALGGFRLEAVDGQAAPVPTMAAPPNPDAATFLAVVNQALVRSAAAPDLAARAARFAGLGIGAAPSPETESLWKQNLPALRAELKPGLAAAGDVVNGWSYPKANIGDYGNDDDLRSYVAVGGLAALPRIEAMYLTARTDKDGATLDGSKAYTVRLPYKMPIGAFWSLTMYQQEPDGSLFFVPNSLNRFAAGDRSPQLRNNRDGSFDIFLQAKQPEGERAANWLPAPKGKFVLVFRAYLPRAEMLDGSFRLPPVETSDIIQ
jgi:hypothetical protein